MVGLLGPSTLSLLITLMPNWWSFAIVWFGIHITNMIGYIAHTVYIVELLGPTKRSLAMGRK